MIFQDVQKPFNYYRISNNAMKSAGLPALGIYLIISILGFFIKWLAGWNIIITITVFTIILIYKIIKNRDEIHCDTLFPYSSKFWMSKNGKVGFGKNHSRTLMTRSILPPVRGKKK